MILMARGGELPARIHGSLTVDAMSARGFTRWAHLLHYSSMHAFPVLTRDRKGMRNRPCTAENDDCRTPALD